MIKNKLTLSILAIVIAGATTFTACKKKDKEETPTVADTDQSGVKANNTAENISSDIVSMGSEACDMQTNSGNLNNYRTVSTDQTTNLSCATVTVDTLNKIVTVAFSGGVCLDGKTRSGSLMYNYSASINGATRYRHPGFKVSVTSNNYAVDGNTVTITNKTISNITPAGFNPLTTNETWSISANMGIALSGGGSITWSCTRVKTLLNTASAYTNSNTPISWSTARIGLTGSASGTRSNGETFSVNVTNQLVRDFGLCTGLSRHVFIQGSLVYSPQGKAARTFDYGSGACDLLATVTINGITYPFAL